MNETTKTYTRRPFIALVLSALSTGLGHIYCGRITKGIILFLISFVFAPVIGITVTGISSTFFLILIIFSVLLSVGIWIYAMIDAYWLAKKTNVNYKLKDYNRWYVYIVFIAATMIFPGNLSYTIRTHLLTAYKIPSVSMRPNILKGDHLFLNKAAYKRKGPKRGDVVVFIQPNKRHMEYIKRIVALPGETIEIRDNRLIINGQMLLYREVETQDLDAIKGQLNGKVYEETNGGVSYKIMLTEGGKAAVNFKKITVPNGHCFVLGDNRENAEDSRDFGPVPLRDIIGKVAYIYYPAESWTRFGRFE